MRGRYSNSLCIKVDSKSGITSSDNMSGLLTGEAKHQANFLLGPWLIGGCIDLVLQGVLSSQFVNYYSYYSDDKGSLKIIVAILALLTVLKSIHAFAVLWINFIVYFGALQEAILLSYTTWYQAGTPLMVAIIGLYVQCYFCFRLWVITKRWYVVLPIATVFLFAFLSIVVGTYFITTSNGKQITQWFAAHLSATFSGDIILSLTTAYFLLKSKKNVLPQTVGLISALIRLTFQTAAPAALCAMFNLIFSQTYSGNDAIISTAFNMTLPKLYAISMMWTLNARRTIRATHGSRNGMSNTSNELSGARSRARRANVGLQDTEKDLITYVEDTQGDMELGAIQIVTQTETTQRVDVRDMFDPSQKNVHSDRQLDTKQSDESVQDSK
ncbi:hypothetical protein MVEN_00745300 [Mycena venus]|uniref:DUF6534 domain-containing protein n=1 Tax=Mycena venus TaxID=2733690 RepID=A0A8H6YFE5_9AGAR|nr:hypothetical protein MVEN_00745300 [Mycena venus]